MQSFPTGHSLIGYNLSLNKQLRKVESAPLLLLIDTASLISADQYQSGVEDLALNVTYTELEISVSKFSCN